MLQPAACGVPAPPICPSPSRLRLPGACGIGSSQHVIENSTNGIDVRPFIQSFSRILLRRSAAFRSITERQLSRFLERDCVVKIDQFYHVVTQQQIFWL